MPIPICISIPPFEDPFEITLPGNVTMEAINLMEILQPALTPLVPLFNVVDTIVAMFNCIKAIPDTLGPPPDPTIIATCLPALSEHIAKLLQLLPQLSVPHMMKRIATLAISVLRVTRSHLLHLQQQMVEILGAIDRATQLEDAGLMAVIQCAQANVAQEAANVGKSLASLGRLLGLFNLFSGMVGGPQAPDLSNLVGRPLDEAIPPLNDLIAALELARDAIPVP
jgi:hypothetical protein